MKPRAKKQRKQTGRDRWNLTPQGIAGTDLDDLDEIRTFADLDDLDDFDDLDHAPGLHPFALAMAREDLDAACAKAAWAPRPATPPTPSGSPGSATRTDPPRSLPQLDTHNGPPCSSPPIERNTPPATVWEALRRLLACNKQQLAARLAISRHTLQRWERGELTEAGAAKVAALMQEALAAAGAGWTVAPLFRPDALKRDQKAAETPG